MKDLQTQTLGAVKELVVGETCVCEARSVIRDADDNSCHEFVEDHSTQINNVVLAELRQKGCVDPGGHYDEVSAEVSLKILRHWNKIHSPKDALHSIATFEARSHARKCRREPPQEIDERDIPLFMSAALDPTDMYEAAIYLEELLSQLDELDRAIFSLRFQDLSLEEIAAVIGMPGAKIRARYYRAIKRLRSTNSSSASNVNPSHERLKVRLDNSMFER